MSGSEAGSKNLDVREYRVRVRWADGSGEEVRAYQASTPEEALCMAERADAGGREAGYTLEGEDEADD